MENKKIILTGDRPTGRLHIGHYFGSLQNRIKLQDEYEEYIMVADVQALTDNFNNPEKVSKSVYELVKDYLSCGIDPKKTTIFVQSQIPTIAELTVFFSNLVTVSRLERNPTVKTEIAQKKELFGNNGESITYGFLGYPVSQSADIASFGAHVIPVGNDQLPMIEQAREIVRKFNLIYGDVLVEPEALVSSFPRVKGLDGNEKMGKSLGNAIYLSDTQEEVEKKVMSALTDTSKIKKDDKADPKKCMVAYYTELFNSENKEKVFEECRDGKRGCVLCKKELAAKINEFLDPIREKRKYYDEHPEIVKKIIYDGTYKANKKASETLKKVKEVMKINYFEE